MATPRRAEIPSPASTPPFFSITRAVIEMFRGDDVRGDIRCYEASPGIGAALVAFDVPGAPPEDAGASEPAEPPPATE